MFFSGYCTCAVIQQGVAHQVESQKEGGKYLSTRVAELESENKNLREKSLLDSAVTYYELPKASYNDADSKPPKGDFSTAECANQKYVDELAEFKAKSEAEKIVGLQGALHKRANDSVNSFEQRFLSQSVDANWGPSQEQKLRGLFSSSLASKSLSVVGNECKRSLCRVTFISSSLDEDQSITSALNEAFYSDITNTTLGSYYAKRDVNSGLTYVYVARDEKSFQDVLSVNSR